MKQAMRLISLLSLLLVSTYTYANTQTWTHHYQVRRFIHEMAREHGFNERKLRALFDEVKYDHTSSKKIKKPFETVPWVFYKHHFLTKTRIQDGLTFWRAHKKTLKRAEKEYGVPASILVAFLGVETQYGKHLGKIRVMDALTTLAFNGNKRAPFFRRELKAYLMLTREQHFHPLDLKGSYAGAFGLPQFMPSSYRAYAVDYDHDKKADLMNSPDDAIGSIGNFLVKHGWKRHSPIVVHAKGHPRDISKTWVKRFTPKLTLKQLKAKHITPKRKIKGNPRVTLVKLGSIKPDYWLGMKNFYVITRYNHDKKYAMVVYLLSRRLERRMEWAKQAKHKQHQTKPKHHHTKTKRHHAYV